MVRLRDLGSSVGVRGAYWATLTPGITSQAAPTADYYPGTGIVHAHVGAGYAGATWFRLDARRQALMDRYAAIAGDPALPDQPSELAVLLAARRDGETEVQVRVDGRPLDPAQSGAFWRFASGLDAAETNLATVFARPAPHATVPGMPGVGADLGVNLGPLHLGPPLAARQERSVDLALPEGRTIFYTFAPRSSLLFGATFSNGARYPGYTLPAVFTSWLTKVAPSSGATRGAMPAGAVAVFAIAALCAVVASLALGVAVWRASADRSRLAGG